MLPCSWDTSFYDHLVGRSLGIIRPSARLHLDTAAQQLYLTQFEQPLALFGPDPPSTRLWFSRLQVHNRLIQIRGFSPSLSFIREGRKANLTIYSYERYHAEGGFVRVF